jgi:beta-glucosidase/6-phospho-beta-glucosidase/beta-galactosidase
VSASFGLDGLVWIAGIEDTCVYPPAHHDMAPLDEYALTGHDDHWRDDLDAVRALGATALRYGVNWPLVHTAPDTFDWRVLDERLAYATSIGLTIIADLVHYGTPTWLAGSFADADYPSVVAEFAGAFAARYRGVVDHITPLNEPVTTASFCGLRGVWPPALTGWDGWTRVVVAMACGIVRSVAAIRAANPDAVIVHVEAASTYVAGDTSLAEHAALLTELGWVPTDLVLGRVAPGHAAYDWLVSHGASTSELDTLVRAPATIDLLGVNYYPDLSPRTLMPSAAATSIAASTDGEDVAQLAVNEWTDGLAAALRAFGERYGLPMAVTETSIEGSDEVRSAWVRDSTACVVALRADGVDVRGYTWWPVFDFVDWSYASGGRNVEEFVVADAVVAARQGSGAKTPYLRRMGLVRLEEQPDGTLDRVPTPAAAEFARVAGVRGSVA